MKRSPALLIFVLTLLLASLACTLPGAVENPPTPLPPTPPPATDTPLPPPPPTEISAPPPPTATWPVGIPATAPVDTPVAPPTLIVVVTEVSPTPLPGAQFLPAGFLTKTQANDGLTFYNLQGRPIGSLDTPGMQYWSPNSYVHVAGPMPADGATLPTVIYFRFDPSPALMINNNDQISTLMDITEFYCMAGAQGEPVLAYNVLGYGNNGLRNRVFAGNLGTILNAAPVLDVTDPESLAIKPWAVVAEAGQPVGVWYTKVMYGIGGDIVFEPRRSLHYLDLTTGDDLTYFGDTITPIGFSPDLTWVAYTAGYAVGPVVIDNLYDAVSPVTIPLLVSSDRGAGDAYFSPDNQYLAWKEGSGWQMAEVPNFQATIRIANNLGAITAEISQDALATAAGGTVEWVAPVGWLDNQTLILEIRTGNWDNASLLQVRYDGSGLAYLAPGAFIDFFYP